MPESSFYEDPLFDGFSDEQLPLPGVFEPQGAADSKQHDFTLEEAKEMRERAAVEQAQKTGGATTYLANPSFDVV